MSLARNVNFLSVAFNDMPFRDVIEMVAGWPEWSGFGYIVTPNVDHVIRINKNINGVASYYSGADLVLNDSRVLKKIAKLFKKDIGVVPGSDLTEAIFKTVISSHDRITIIGASERTVEVIKLSYRLCSVAHYNPPMGFIKSSEEVAKCVEFVVAHPARFVFLAVGSPQQEMIAYELKNNTKTQGLGLCVGASLNFLAGEERRAPKIVQKVALEWLYRLVNDPRRLWKRYLLGGPALAKLIVREWVTRDK